MYTTEIAPSYQKKHTLFFKSLIFHLLTHYLLHKINGSFWTLLRYCHDIFRMFICVVSLFSVLLSFLSYVVSYYVLC
jgi:hypothetical protein